jgi:hypothetical protein
MGLLLICALAGPISYCTAGGDFFDARPTELESKKTLREVRTVRETPDVQMPRPSAYTDPPQIVEGTVNGKPDAKLYYFARYQMVDKLAVLFNEQFVKVLYDNEGNAMPAVPYTIDSISATHQIIVSCPSVEYAQQVLYFFEQIDVPPIQIRIDCLISEVYADQTLDWQTHLQVQNLFGSQIAMEGKLPGAALRDLARSSFGMKAGQVDGGYWDPVDGRFVVTEPGHMFGALVDLLTSRGYLKILMNPHLEVLNGQTATIRTEEYVTIDQISTIDPATGEPFLYPKRETIIDSLEVTPQAFADGTIGIKTVALIGSKGTPEGVRQIPIVTTRKITIAENRIRRGESLVIGGIRKSEQRSVVRGVPGLKDIPVLGVLFSSKDFEERAKEILFIITPTISSGGVPNKDIVADIQRKHTPIKNSDLIENLKDPFGSGAYTTLVEQEAIEAEVGRLRAEMEKAAADRKSEELIKKIATASRQAEGETKQGERAVAAAKTETAAAQAAIVAAKAQAAETQTKIAAAQKLLADEKDRITAAAAEQKQATDAAKTAAGAAAAAQAEAEAAKADAEAAKAEAEARLAEWIEVKKANGAKTPPTKDGPAIKPNNTP